MLTLKSFQQFYSDHIDPDGIQPIHALRTTFAALLAMIVYRAFDWPQAYWMVFSTVLIIQFYNSPIPALKWKFIIGTGISAILCTFTTSLLCQNTIIFGLFLMVSTFITIYLGTLRPDIGSAAFYVNLFCLSAGALPLGITETLQRTASVSIGFIIAMAVCLFLWPENLNTSIRIVIAENLSRLNEFNRALTERSRNEKVIAIRRNRLMRGFQLARTIIPKEEIQSLQIILQIECLYEIILVLNELKQSIEKQKILRIINKELSILSRRLSVLLRGYSRTMRSPGFFAPPPVTKFIHTLESFEKYYRRHLKKFNHAQFLSFTVYINAVHKLEKRIQTLAMLIQQKGFHA